RRCSVKAALAKAGFQCSSNALWNVLVFGPHPERSRRRWTLAIELKFPFVAPHIQRSFGEGGRPCGNPTKTYRPRQRRNERSLYASRIGAIARSRRSYPLD